MLLRRNLKREGSMMNLVEVTEFGGPEVLRSVEVPDLVAGSGEVVVRVAAADVLLVEAVVRMGLGVDFFPLRPPYVPGGAVAGEVSSVGRGVDPAWLGRRVAVRTDGRNGYAEQVLTTPGALIPVPDGLGLQQAAALLHDGPTALTLFGNAKIQPGEHVLITAAAGAMGVLLVQLAHAAGATVTGAARGQDKLALILELGADAAVDYSTPGWTERALAASGGRRPDVILDGAGGPLGEAAFTLIATGGRFSAHGAAGGLFAHIDPEEAARRRVTVTGIEPVQFTPAEARALTQRSLTEAAAGTLRPFIGQTFPLSDAPAAHTAIESRRTLGKTLLLSDA
ncbi:zinc-binding dehydrogenase [Actinocorallia lasiicapitis]